jgi:hypothetical protein
MDDQLTLRGEVKLTLRGPNGLVKRRFVTKNLVVTTGKEGIADQMATTPTIGVPKYIAVGKSSTAAEAANTALGEESKRKEATTRSRSGKVLTLAVEFGAGEGTATLKEAGIFTASSGGTMYSRTVFEGIAKGAEDTLTVTWKLTIE